MNYSVDLAKQGFAKCNKAQGQKKLVFYSASYMCNAWEEAPEAAVKARKKVMG
jgi:hypothetical protein